MKLDVGKLDRLLSIKFPLAKTFRTFASKFEPHHVTKDPNNWKDVIVIPIQICDTGVHRCSVMTSRGVDQLFITWEQWQGGEWTDHAPAACCNRSDIYDELYVVGHGKPDRHETSAEVFDASRVMIWDYRAFWAITFTGAWHECNFASLQVSKCFEMTARPMSR